MQQFDIKEFAEFLVKHLESLNENIRQEIIEGGDMLPRDYRDSVRNLLTTFDFYTDHLKAMEQAARIPSNCSAWHICNKNDPHFVCMYCGYRKEENAV